MSELPCCYRVLRPDGLRELHVNARDGLGWRVLLTSNCSMAVWALTFTFSRMLQQPGQDVS